MMNSEQERGVFILKHLKGVKSSVPIIKIVDHDIKIISFGNKICIKKRPESSCEVSIIK